MKTNIKKKDYIKDLSKQTLKKTVWKIYNNKH